MVLQHQDLSSDLQLLCKKLGKVVLPVNQAPKRERQEDPLSLLASLTSHISEIHVNMLTESLFIKIS